MAKSRVNQKNKKQKLTLKWWYAIPVILLVAVAGFIIVRFSNASTNGKADFKVNATSDFSVAILQAKNGASVEVNSCLYLNDAYGGVEQVRVWYRRLTKDPQDPKKDISLYDGYYAVSSNQVPSQLQYGGTWLDNNQSANSYLAEKTFNVNFPDLGLGKYKSGENKNQKIYVGLFYGTNPFNKDIKNPTQKDTEFVNNAIFARGGQAIALNKIKLCLNSPNQKLANKQEVPKKINGTKSNETRFNREGDAPYSKSLESIKNSKNYIGTISTKYAGNFYVTACARSQGGSIFTVDSAAWFADPRYVAWGKFGVSSDFWIKNNGTEVAGPTSGRWAYGVVASLNTQAIDYSNSSGLQFGITDYNTFTNPPALDVASLQYDMQNLKMCDTGKAIPAKSSYIIPSITGNSQQTIDQANSPVSDDSYPLHLGSQGSNVVNIQGYLGIQTDGIFGPATLQAVLSYQASNGLDQTGIVGLETLAKMQQNISNAFSDAVKKGETVAQCTIWWKNKYNGNNYYGANYFGITTKGVCESGFKLSSSDGDLKNREFKDTGLIVAGYEVDHYQWNGQDYK